MIKRPWLLIFGFLLFNSPSAMCGATDGSVPPEVLTVAEKALLDLEQNDMTSFSTLVHPIKGVQFFAYRQEESDDDPSLSPAKIASLSVDTSTYNWGSYDGSGTPINLTWNNYRKVFVYDKDYVKKGRRTVVVSKRDSSQASAPAVSRIGISFYVASSKNPDGLDWGRLTILFEPFRNHWMIVRVVHDQWTI